MRPDAVGRTPSDGRRQSTVRLVRTTGETTCVRLASERGALHALTVEKTMNLNPTPHRVALVGMCCLDVEVYGFP